MTRRKGKTLWTLAIVMLFLSFGLWLANEVYADHNRNTIERVTAAIQQLRLNESTVAIARDRLQSITGRKARLSMDAEGNTEIQYSLVVPQGGLKGLGRIFWFSSTLTFDSGDRLISKRILMTSNSHVCCSAEIWELPSFVDPEQKDFKVVHYDRYSIIVQLGPNANENGAPWDWQLSCLTSIAGCNDIRQVFPSLRPRRND